MSHVHAFRLRKFYIDDVGTFYGFACEASSDGRAFPYFTRGVMGQIGQAWAAIDGGHSWTYSPSTDVYTFVDADAGDPLEPERVYGEVHNVDGNWLRLYRLWPDEWQIDDDDDDDDA